jgi:hypothetical protein
LFLCSLFVKTDQQGRFVIHGLAPGGSYELDAVREPGEGFEPWFGRLASGIVVRLGETKDLGNLTPKVSEVPSP